MKTISQIIKHANELRERRGWDNTYWAIDLHDTIITGEYNKFNEGSTIYPHAKEVLDYLYNSKIHRTILWTSSYVSSVEDVLKRFELKFHYFNINPECPSTELCDFNGKFYFNIGLDDKFGFCPMSDWLEIRKALSI